MTGCRPPSPGVPLVRVSAALTETFFRLQCGSGPTFASSTILPETDLLWSADVSYRDIKVRLPDTG